MPDSVPYEERSFGASVDESTLPIVESASFGSSFFKTDPSDEE